MASAGPAGVGAGAVLSSPGFHLAPHCSCHLVAAPPATAGLPPAHAPPNSNRGSLELKSHPVPLVPKTHCRLSYVYQTNKQKSTTETQVQPCSAKCGPQQVASVGSRRDLLNPNLQISTAPRNLRQTARPSQALCSGHTQLRSDPPLGGPSALASSRITCAVGKECRFLGPGSEAPHPGICISEAGRYSGTRDKNLVTGGNSSRPCQARVRLLSAWSAVCWSHLPEGAFPNTPTPHPASFSRFLLHGAASCSVPVDSYQSRLLTLNVCL